MRYHQAIKAHVHFEMNAVRVITVVWVAEAVVNQKELIAAVTIAVVGLLTHLHRSILAVYIAKIRVCVVQFGFVPAEFITDLVLISSLFISIHGASVVEVDLHWSGRGAFFLFFLDERRHTPTITHRITHLRHFLNKCSQELAHKLFRSFRKFITVRVFAIVVLVKCFFGAVDLPEVFCLAFLLKFKHKVGFWLEGALDNEKVLL